LQTIDLLVPGLKDYAESEIKEEQIGAKQSHREQCYHKDIPDQQFCSSSKQSEADPAAIRCCEYEKLVSKENGLSDAGYI